MDVVNSINFVCDGFVIKTLEPDDEKLFSALEVYFLEKIKPLYGDQTEPLRKVREGKDRVCDLIINSNEISGFVIYKNHVTDEFKNCGVVNGVEIKTLLLIDKKIKTAGKFFKLLIGRAAQQAVAVDASCIFSTVSANRPEVLRLTNKLGFKIVKTFYGKYIEKTEEYLISHPNPRELVAVFNKNS